MANYRPAEAVTDAQVNRLRQPWPHHPGIRRTVPPVAAHHS
jgi:hypothetical protein